MALQVPVTNVAAEDYIPETTPNPVTPGGFGTTVGYQFTVSKEMILKRLTMPNAGSALYAAQAAIWNTSSGLMLSSTIIDQSFGHDDITSYGYDTNGALKPYVVLEPNITYTVAVRLPNITVGGALPLFSSPGFTPGQSGTPPMGPDFTIITGLRNDGTAGSSDPAASIVKIDAMPVTHVTGIPVALGFESEYTYITYISEPYAPTIKAVANEFQISLPTNAIPPELTEWDIQVATSTDNSIFSDWKDLVSLPATTHTYTHTNLTKAVLNKDGSTTTTYYEYRYRYRTKTDQSLWSDAEQAGEPREGEAGVSPATGTDLGVIQLSGDLTGSASSPTVAPGAIDGSKIADGTITDVDISPAANISTSKLNPNPLDRTNHTGTQLSSTISDFDSQVEYIFVQSVAANVWTIPYPSGWRGNRRPAVTIVDSASTVVVGNIVYNADNTITVSFEPAGAQFSGKAYLN